jgi:hypothetical protein
MDATGPGYSPCNNVTGWICVLRTVCLTLDQPVGSVQTAFPQPSAKSADGPRNRPIGDVEDGQVPWHTYGERNSNLSRFLLPK